MRVNTAIGRHYAKVLFSRFAAAFLILMPAAVAAVPYEKVIEDQPGLLVLEAVAS
jgi:hypothetical protein